LSSSVRFGAVALAASAALALPGAASAADVNTAVVAVTAHTERADAALDRAVSNFAKGRDAQGRRAFAKSRKEMGLATAAAAKALREAETPEERRQAARALASLAAERDENVEKLVSSLREADGRTENQIAAAARSDTRGREKAIAVLTALLGQVPEQGKEGITRAIASLSTERDDEVLVEAKALSSRQVSRASKRSVAGAVESSVDGQGKAAETLAALLAGEDMPEQSKPGLQRAYDAVSAEHGEIAGILGRFSDRMPAFVRSFVEQIVTQAREDAQEMRENRPAPPSETQSQQPEGTPSGQPEGTPGGRPDGAATA
jgi:hypothetical protein